MYRSVVVARATHVDMAYNIYHKKRTQMSPSISCVHGIDTALLYDIVLSVGASTECKGTAVLACTLGVE